ncbi:DNA/RNA non-specific endonuclease [Lactobacillus terrae]|uniref:DNA/RNA non-specific endonuclease n=1 Tax=Lactobacillus terrae TaxID=2269374 RepID=UPI000C1B7499|nr:DNA/RNA non-specific endonuclease [Lactobacillus terrae]
MYMIGLIVVGVVIVFSTYVTKPKKKTYRNLMTAGLVLVIAGGSGLYESFQMPSKSSPSTANNIVKSNSSYSDLAKLNYDKEQIITINGDKPTFSDEELSTSRGAWEEYSNLDRLNRAGVANAMLNKGIMPTAKREQLYVDPTGWHNKKINGHDWLYNRSHLIGYQFTGQNNNPKNLITGTKSLNNPGMLKYEEDMAYYIRRNPENYVRYRVEPVYRGNELVARGVHMMATSLTAQGRKDGQVSFNIYIFNIEKGVKINYTDGTSKIVNNN